jgi:hypothetical protein
MHATARSLALIGMTLHHLCLDEVLLQKLWFVLTTERGPTMDTYRTDAGEGIPGFHHPQRLLAVSTASRLYQSSYTQSLMGRVWSALNGLPCRLLDLATIQAACDVRSRHVAGIRPVPIREIRGSDGRSEDFDADFRPLRPHTKDRWMEIAVAQQLGETMPPVDLVRIGDAYFVRDGHHRISVARALGQEKIDARITVWEVTRPRARKHQCGWSQCLS